MKNFKVPDIHKKADFEEICFEVFNYQYHQCTVYQDFCKYLNIAPHRVKDLSEIPFLPIELFKQHQIISGEIPIEKVFTSSGTTGKNTSRHYVSDLNFYLNNAEKIFEQAYGSLKDYAILALLPSYLERSDSSLVYMVEDFIKKSQHPDSGFFLYNHKVLFEKLRKLESVGQKTLLIGVSFGLLDFAEEYQIALKHTTVMETGGMKGRRKEMIREELHDKLKNAFGLAKIHSEYGMTELLSQAYSKGDGIFKLPETMRVFIRESEDPLTVISEYNKSGGLNIIDLANVNSCSFLATQDLGMKVNDRMIKILGRFDASDVRGCNLLTIN